MKIEIEDDEEGGEEGMEGGGEERDRKMMLRCIQEVMRAQPQLDEDSAARMCEQRMKEKMPAMMPMASSEPPMGGMMGE